MNGLKLLKILHGLERCHFIIPEIIVAVDPIWENRYITIGEIAVYVKIRVGSMQSIVTLEVHCRMFVHDGFLCV